MSSGNRATQEAEAPAEPRLAGTLRPAWSRALSSSVPIHRIPIQSQRISTMQGRERAWPDNSQPAAPRPASAIAVEL